MTWKTRKLYKAIQSEKNESRLLNTSLLFPQNSGKMRKRNSAKLIWDTS